MLFGCHHDRDVIDQGVARRDSFCKSRRMAEMSLPPMMRWRTAATIALLIVLFIPVFRGGDGVPLSTYPMYAAPRAATVEFIVPVGIDVQGEPVDLSTQQIAATVDPLIAETYLRNEARAGRSGEVCAAIARRVGSTAAVEVEIWREVHRVGERIRGDASIELAESLARCDVP